MEKRENAADKNTRGYDRKFAERIVREVKEDFEKRRAERRTLERGWELNMNFLAGNQYCDVGPTGKIEEEEPRFYWQYRRVFNHIAPAIDTRCAKLSRVRPDLTVRAARDQESDLRTAKTASAVLRLKRNPPAMPVVARGREKALAAASVSIQKSSGVLN